MFIAAPATNTPTTASGIVLPAIYVAVLVTNHS